MWRSSESKSGGYSHCRLRWSKYRNLYICSVVSDDVIYFLHVSQCSESTDRVVVGKDGHGVDYKSARKEVKLIASDCSFYLKTPTAKKWFDFFSNQDTKSFAFDQVVTADNVEVQNSFWPLMQLFHLSCAPFYPNLSPSVHHYML